MTASVGTTEDVLTSVDSRPASAVTDTVEDVLECVDVCPALPKPTDDVPSPPGHCTALALDIVVDDVEVCLSSVTMKKTVWDTPEEARSDIKK